MGPIRFILLCALAALGTGRLIAQARSPLRGTAFSLSAVEDSGWYLVYRYTIANDPGSTGGAAVLTLDVSAPRGTGLVVLPPTGRFVNGPGVPGVTGATDHVPFGPISPENWEAFLNKNATLDWYGAHGGFEGDVDSIAPGGTLEGFGLRSSYLPGLRRSAAAPTFRSCCTKIRPETAATEPENPNPKEFRVGGWTVGPMVRPSDLSIATLLTDLDRTCGQLRWISDGSLCGRLRSSLQKSAAALRRGDARDARQGLAAILQELENQSGPGKSVNENAYWLLRVNASYLVAHL